MDTLQTSVLVAGTALLVVATSVILWRELGWSTQGGFLRGWRDVLGMGVTLGGLVVLLTWLWASR